MDLINLIGFGEHWKPTVDDLNYGGNLVYLVNISQTHPRWLAKPIYGYAAPLITIVTFVTNTFIIIVLSNKNLRTPTNYILLSMAVAELLTGFSSLPWFLYYYMFDGIEVDQSQGLPTFWCKAHFYFAVNLPTIFHTSAIWLTCYLAVQRYIYVCHPSLVARYCNPRRTMKFIVLICTAAVFGEFPSVFSEYSETLTVNSTNYCFRKELDVIDEVIGRDAWNASLYFYRAIFVHIIPCILISVFSFLLIRTIKNAERKRSIVLGERKKSSTGFMSTPNSLMNSTTRMLVVVIAIFLAIEIPVALIFIVHFVMVYYKIMSMSIYESVNTALIVRNFLIILTYPLNFAIYFGMSSAFKLQFRQLFSRQVLYVVQEPDPVETSARPRFSIQLIDVRKLRTTGSMQLRKVERFGRSWKYRQAR